MEIIPFIEIQMYHSQFVQRHRQKVTFFTFMLFSVMFRITAIYTLSLSLPLFMSRDDERLITAVSMFLELVQKSDFPEFLTTYLYLDHTFLSAQCEHEDRGTDRSHQARL